MARDPKYDLLFEPIRIGPKTLKNRRRWRFLRCECGEVASVTLGDTVECACGRAYDTSKLPAERFAQVRAHQAKARLYTRLGFIFVVGVAVVTRLMWGVKGAAIGAPLAGLVWFRFVRRRFMCVFVPSPGELPTLELEASER